nr:MULTISPECIES: type II toxin-antitoxin system HipA family toxin [unclassified Rhizobacter]
MVMGQLAVWMNGEFVGVWSNDHAHSFEYAASWLESERARPLSLSLPLTSTRQLRGAMVESYFDNLLPDNDAIRKRIRARFGTRSTDAFALLSAIGRDCVGAAQLLPVGQQPHDIRRVEHEALSEDDIARLLRDVPVMPAFGAAADTDDFRISIAGAQEKTALLRFNGQWCKPLHATPTTHILKLPLGKVSRYNADFGTSVENEWLCARILRELGLEVADTGMATFGDQRVLVVERFDRTWVDTDDGSGAYLIRLPQEDMCQATGTAPARKYENEGGPGIDACLAVLGNSETPWQARRAFVLAQLAFWLLAAPDGHAKNFSIFIHRGGAYSMTPLYDVLSAWPLIGKGANRMPYQDAGLAMALRSKNAHSKFGEIETRHWHQLAHVTAADLWVDMIAMVESVGPALDRVQAALPGEFPGRVWEPIAAGMRRHARKFLQTAAP